jgi:cell wall-associated NlpC family hydrolase
MSLRNYIGIPFSPRQSGFDGADCYGLIRLFYRTELMIELPGFNISPDDKARIFAQYINARQQHWTVSSAADFAVVAMANNPRAPKMVNHFGIYIAGKILHTLKSVGSHLVSIDSVRWSIINYHAWQP